MYLPVKDKHRLKIKGYKIFFQAKGAWKQAGVAKTHIWQSRLQTKIGQKRQKRSYHIDKGNNLLGGYNNYKHNTLKVSTPNFMKQTLPDIKATDIVQNNNSGWI
jgi:hypothetical protein